MPKIVTNSFAKKIHVANGKAQYAFMMCLVFLLGCGGVGGRGGGMSGFLVAWVFPSFHFYLFLVEELVENHVFFYNFSKRKRQIFFEKG